VQGKVSEVLGLEEKLQQSLLVHQQAQREGSLALEEQTRTCEAQVGG